jgi:hypothetical protein
MCITAHRPAEGQNPDHAPHQVVFQIADLTTAVARVLITGEVLVPGHAVPRGIFSLYPPKGTTKVMDNVYTLRCCAMEGHPQPDRDQLYSVFRESVSTGLKASVDSVDKWTGEPYLFNPEGWIKKQSEYDYDYGGVDAYTAYANWKHQETQRGAHFTEHSTHNIWNRIESGSVMGSFKHGKVTKEAARNPMDGVLNIRCPKDMGGLILEIISSIMAPALNCEIFTFEPVFTSTAIKILDGTQSISGNQRAQLLRITAVLGTTGADRWHNPEALNEMLIWKGYNIGGTYLEILPFAP